MWTSAKTLGKGLLAHWVQLLGGTGMALVGLAASIQDWTVPPRVWVALSVLMFFWPILKAFHEQRLQLEKVEGALADRRQYQEIADALTDLHAYAVRELITGAPKETTGQHFTEWFSKCRRWRQNAEATMERLHCTKQDINHLSGMSPLEVNYQNAEKATDAYVFVIAEMATRVANVATKYAKMAEDVRVRR